MMRYFKIWIGRVVEFHKRKRCRIMASLTEARAARKSNRFVLQVWSELSKENGNRKRICTFFDSKQYHALKMEYFLEWMWCHRREKDLIRRVNIESELCERKMNADIAMCQRMLQRYEQRRRERQIYSAYIGWHVHCVNMKHIETF